MRSTFRHAALVVESDESLRARLIPTLRDSVERNEPVLMVVGPATERVVRADPVGASDRLEWGDTGAFYQRLGFAFEGFRRYLADQYDSGRQVHVVAEPDLVTGTAPNGPVDRLAAYMSYESMCNEAYAAYNCPVTCIWDSRRYPDPIIENARKMHNHEVTDAGHVVNPGHVPPPEYLAGRNDVPLPTLRAPTDLDLVLAEPDDLAALSAALWSWAYDRDFSGAAAGDVVVAVVETATNGLVHGLPPVRVRGWHQAGMLVAQVDDRGGRPLPPTAGYVAPGLAPEERRGLWMARQFADVVTAYSAGGTTSVRLHFPYEITHTA